tara:strand:+ start:49700 stop:49969 length:270 start_codon:yes stop_codon:yes gene_type:complete
MPRYRYRCEICANEVMVFHLMSESYNNCQVCDGVNSMEKMLTTPLKKIEEQDLTNDRNLGDLTHQYIKENREILEEERKKAKRETYEPS